MNQFLYNMVRTTWVLKHALPVIDYTVLTMHGEKKTKVIRILTRHNQLSNGWPKMLNLVSKIVNEKFPEATHTKPYSIHDMNVSKIIVRL